MYHWYSFENVRRGTYQFPIEYYHVSKLHPRYVMPYHWHPEIEIIRIQKGFMTLYVDTETYHLKQNDILYIPQNAVHGGMPEDCDCIYECIVCDFFGLLQGNTSFSSYANLFINKRRINACYDASFPEIYSVLSLLFKTMKNKSTGWQILTIGCLLQFFGFVLEKNYFDDAPNDKVLNRSFDIHRFQKVFKLIRSRYAEPLTLEDMATEANMSPTYFCRLFKEITHYSPIEYLMNYRIEYSKYLLCTKHVSVAEAAFLCGFNSCAYFIKIFKSFTGVTPNNYKKQYLISK